MFLSVNFIFQGNSFFGLHSGDKSLDPPFLLFAEVEFILN